MREGGSLARRDARRFVMFGGVIDAGIAFAVGTAGVAFNVRASDEVATLLARRASPFSLWDAGGQVVFVPGRAPESMRPRLIIALTVVALLLAALGLAGCSQGSRSRHTTATNSTRPAPKPAVGRTVAGVSWVPSSPALRKQCQETADAVRYAVPCPTIVPQGIQATPPVRGCRFAVIGWDYRRGCGAVKWRGWMVGSSQTDTEHLAVQAAPRIVRNAARAIDGPGMFPGSRVQARGVVRVAGRIRHWYYVPPDLNGGSAFMHHLVLVWTASGHTYAYGFHVVTTFADARALDLELVRHLVVVQPRHASSGITASRPLLSILGVLRRPQTSADRNPALLRELREQSHSRTLSVIAGKPVISLVRLATVAPWGAKIFLVPYRPLTRQAIAKLPPMQQVVAHAAKMSLMIYATGLTSGNQPAAEIEGGRDLANSATGRSDQFAMVVPDGVARVALWNATGSIRAHPHPLVPPHSKPIIVTVHDNVAAVRSRKFGSVGREIWYGPSGQIVKRIANASSCAPPLGNCA